MPTLIQSALLAEVGRASGNPVPFKAPGTYQQNVIQAQQWTITLVAGVYGGAPTPVTPGTAVPFLLFCSDRPSRLTCVSRYADATLAAGVVLPQPTYDEEVQADATAASVGFAALTPAVAPVGQVFRGTTNTGNVRVDGYIARADVVDRGLLDANGGALLPTLELRGIYPSGVVSGYPGLYAGDANTDTVITILMQEALYTQAMQTAGDVIVLPGGGFGGGDGRAQIVGLF